MTCVKKCMLSHVCLCVNVKKVSSALWAGDLERTAERAPARVNQAAATQAVWCPFYLFRFRK